MHLLQRPHRLEKVLAVLEKNFGGLEIKWSYNEDLERQMDSLSHLVNPSRFTPM